MKNELIVKIPIFNMEVFVYLGDISFLKDRLFDKYRVVVDDDFSNCGGVSINLERDYKVANKLVLAVDQFWKYKLSYAVGVLTHEAVHVSTMVTYTRGMAPEGVDDEFRAHIAQYLVEEILKKIGIDKSH